MGLEQIANILRESPLDRETKLFVIDLLTLSDDERLVKDIMDLVLDWKKTDTETVEILHQALFAISEEYRARMEALERTQQTAGLNIADHIKSEEKIQTIRQTLTAAV